MTINHCAGSSLLSLPHLPCNPPSNQVVASAHSSPSTPAVGKVGSLTRWEGRHCHCHFQALTHEPAVVGTANQPHNKHSWWIISHHGLMHVNQYHVQSSAYIWPTTSDRIKDNPAAQVIANKCVQIKGGEDRAALQAAVIYSAKCCVDKGSRPDNNASLHGFQVHGLGSLT